MQNTSSYKTTEETSTQTSTESPEATLEIKRQELDQAQETYDATIKLVKAKKQKASALWEIYSENASNLDRLVYRRDYLNQELRDKRKEIRLLEQDLQNVKTELSELEETTNGVRRAVNRVRRKANTTLADFEAAEAAQLNAEQMLEAATKRLKSAETAFRLAGGKLPQKTVGSRNNPWISGSFYLFAAVVVITLLAVIGRNIPLYTLAIVFISGLLLLAIIGALQLRNDASLSEENFLKLMIEVFKRLPLLKGDPPTEILETNKAEDEEPETVDGT